jgi:hypothetical protein
MTRPPTVSRPLTISFSTSRSPPTKPITPSKYFRRDLDVDPDVPADRCHGGDDSARSSPARHAAGVAAFESVSLIRWLSTSGVKGLTT